ncbi:MAG: Ldh family oxidoreductase, partial [Clostridia bacterium]|nr:Ldh family oxidoreductase [Clostridia bacterium]
TNDPKKINESGMMMPMALWKGSALSIMIDMATTMLSLGRASHDIGDPSLGEKGMSQLFICMNPAAVVDMDAADAKLEETIAFLGALEPREGMSGVHAPGENLAATRRKHMEGGIPVTEATWAKIVELAK